jgi:hypothetical protein
MGLPTCTAAHERRRSCSTNASRSAGVSVSSTTSSASPTESDTAHVHEYALTSMFMCLFGMLAASAPSAGVLARSPNLAQCQSSASGRTSVGYALVGRFRTPSARKPWTPVSRPTRGRQVPPSLSGAAGAVAGCSTARKRRTGGVQLGGIRTTGTPQERSPSAPTPAPPDGARLLDLRPRSTRLLRPPPATCQRSQPGRPADELRCYFKLRECACDALLTCSRTALRRGSDSPL